jgi:hypothetical protein
LQNVLQNKPEVATDGTQRKEAIIQHSEG